MGESLHITRAANWRESASQPIPAEDLLRLVESDPELEWADATQGAASPVLWTYGVRGPNDLLVPRDGRIDVPDADPRLKRKMFAVAAALGARVQDESGAELSGDAWRGLLTPTPLASTAWPGELVLRHSPVKLVAGAIGLGVATVVCWALLDQPRGGIFLAAGVLLCPAMMLYCLAKLFDRRPVVVISPEGIDDRRWGLGTVPFSAIRALYVATNRRHRSSRMLFVEFHDPAYWMGKLPVSRAILAKMNESVGAAPVTYSFGSLDRSIDDVLGYLAYLKREKSVEVTVIE